MVIVRVADAVVVEVVRGIEALLQVTPVGKPEQLRVIVPVKPPTAVAVTVTIAEPPAVGIVTLAGDDVR